MNKMAIHSHVIFRPRNAKTLFLLFLHSGKPMIFEKKRQIFFVDQGIVITLLYIKIMENPNVFIEEIFK